MEKRFRKILISLMMAMLAVVLTSCDEFLQNMFGGIGPSVDVDAPVVEVTSHSFDDVIKGSIVFEGTCQDDKGVDSVIIQVRDNSSKKVVDTVTAEVTEYEKKVDDGTSIHYYTWTADLNEYDETKYSLTNGYKYADGNYTFKAIVSDGGKSSSQEVGLIIDNTAPVFCFISPNSISTTDPTSFGSFLKITGEVSEKNGISEAKVFVYDDTGKLITEEPFDFENPEVTEFKIAEYFPSTKTEFTAQEAVLKANYDKLYAGADGKTKQYFLALQLTDKAGNTSLCTYLKEGTYEKISKDASVNDLRLVLNGTYKKGDVATIRASLKDSEVGAFDKDADGNVIAPATINVASKKYPVFSLNNKANPTYEVVGYDLTDGLKNCTSKGQLNIKVNAGLNGTPVLPKIEVKLVPATQDKVTKKVTEDNTKDVITIDHTSIKANGKNWDTLETNVTSAIYTVDLPVLAPSTVYIVKVETKDTDEVDIEALRKNDEPLVYAFVVATSGTPVEPKFDDTDDDGLIANNYHLSFSGTFTTETEIVTNNTTYTVSCNGESWTGIITLGDDYDGENFDKTFTWKVEDISKDTAGNTHSPADDITKTMTIVFTFDNGTKTKAELKKTVSIDTKKPVVAASFIGDIETTEKATVGGNEITLDGLVNGVVGFTGTITETSGCDICFYVEQAVDGGAAYTPFPANAAFTLQAYLTGYEDNNVGKIPSQAAYIAKIQQYAAGVAVDVTPTTSNEARVLELFQALYVDNSKLLTLTRDTVKREGANTDPAYVSGQVLLFGDNAFTYQAPMVGTLSIDNFEVPMTIFNDGAILHMECWAKDYAGNEGDHAVKNYKVDFSTDAPVVKLNGLNEKKTINEVEAYVLTSDTIKISGTAEDDDYLESVTVGYKEYGQSDDSIVWKTFAVNGNNKTKDFAVTIPTDKTTQAIYQVYVKAEDKAKGTSYYNKNFLEVDSEKSAAGDVNSIYVIVDKVAPVVTVTKDFTKYTTVAALELEATITDGLSFENKDSVNVVVLHDDVDVSTAKNVKIEKTLVDNKTITVKVSVKEGTAYANDGEWTVELTGSDMAGHNFNKVTKQTIIDTKVPVLKDTKIESVAVNTGKWYNNTSLSISGNYEEFVTNSNNKLVGSGVTQTKYVVKTVNEAPTADEWKNAVIIKTNDPVAENVPFDQAVKGLKQGVNYVWVKAVDNAGNESAVSDVITVQVDTQAPTIETTTDSKIFANGNAVTVTGTFTDDYSGIESIQVSYRGKDNDNAKKDVTIDTGLTGTWSFTLEKDSYLETQPELIVKDIAGNEKTYKTSQINLDTTPPVVESNFIGSIATDLKGTVRGEEVTLDGIVNGIVTFSGTITESSGCDICFYVEQNDVPYPANAAFTLQAYLNGYNDNNVGTIPSQAAYIAKIQQYAAGVAVDITPTTVYEARVLELFQALYLDNTKLLTLKRDQHINGEYVANEVLLFGDNAFTYQAPMVGTLTIDKFEVPMNIFTDGAILHMECWAVDYAGNVGEKAIQNYKIDFSSDAPVISLVNFEKKTITSDLEPYFAPSTNKFEATITDDDSIESVTVRYKEYGAADSTFVTKTFAANKSTYKLVFDFPKTPGEDKLYEVYISAQDTKKETEYAVKHFLYDSEEATTPLNATAATESKILVAVDNQTPVVTVTKDFTEYSTNSAISLTATVSDGLAMGSVDNVDVVVKHDDAVVLANKSVKVEKTLSADAKTVNVSVAVSSVKNTANDGTWTVEISGNDLAEHSFSPVTKQTIVDTKAPVLVNPLIESKDAYADAWYKGDKLDISGSYEEYISVNSKYIGSGIDTIKYILKQENVAPVASDWNSALSFNAGTESATKAPFTSTVKGLVNGNNYLWLKAVDKAGNESTVSDVITIKVDNGNPTVDCNVATIFAKGDAVVVEGSYSDDMAGVNSITVDYTNKSNKTVTIPAVLTTSDDGLTGTWKATIPANSYTTCKLAVKVYDNAGNENSTGPSLELDNVAPTFANISPIPSEVVNKTIQIKGEVTDDKNDVKNVTIVVSGNEVTKTYKVTADGKYFTNTVDTTEFYNGNETCELTINISAEDTVGNISTPTVLENTLFNIIVDQNKDRPSVKLTNLSIMNGSYLLNTSGANENRYNVNFSISDDDGIVETFLACEKQIIHSTRTSDSINVTFADKTTATFPIAENKVECGTYGYIKPAKGERDYTFIPTEDYMIDGNKDLYFYIKDANGTEFYSDAKAVTTKDNAQLSRVLIVDADHENGYDTANKPLTYLTDSDKPSFKGLKQYFVINDTDVLINSDTSVGGNNSVVDLKVSATDSNGISKLTVYISSDVEKKVLNYDSSKVGTFVGTTDETPATYTIKDIDFSSFLTGGITIDIEATDTTGQTNSTQLNPNADNDGPNVEVTTDLSEVKTSSVKLEGNTIDVGSAKVASTMYAIPSKAQITAAKGDDSYYVENLTWTANSARAESTAWSFVFDETKDEALVNFCNNDYATVDSGVYSIPVFFKTVDKLGNTTVDTSNVIKYNPDGDKPVSEISYPTTSDYDEEKDYITLGGSIRVSGSCDIPDNSVKLSNNSKKVVTNVTVQVSTDAAFAEGKTTETAATLINANTWIIDLNKKGEYNNKLVYVRARATHEFGKVGEWSEARAINFIMDAPETSIVLNKFADGADVTTATPIETKEYITGTFLKDQWYAKVSFTSKTGIDTSNVSVYGNNDVIVDASEYVVVKSTTPVSGKYTDYVYVKINKDGDSKLSYKVNVLTLKLNQSVLSTFNVNVDNKGPTIEALNDCAKTPVSISMTKLRNSDYRLKFGGAISDDNGSGVDKVVYFFKRVKDGNTTVELPLPVETNGKLSGEGYVVDVTSSTANAEGLYGTTVVGSVNGSVFTATSDISSNKHIRVGGLIQVNGNYYTITSVNGKKVTFNGTTSSATSAFFPVAFVVDNSSAEVWVPQNFNITNDDGDGIYEELTSEKWATAVFSDALDDGEVSIECVAFDTVGNASEVSSTTVMLANHTPRLSKVFVATDLNADGNFTADEFDHTSVVEEKEVHNYFYTALDANNNEQEVVTLDTAFNYLDSDKVTKTGKLSVKDKMAVTFEFTGSSTQDVTYIANLATTAASSPVTGKASTALSALSNVSGEYTTGKEIPTVGVSFDKFAGVSGKADSMEDKDTYLQITLWDNVNITSDDATNSKYIATTDTVAADGTYTSFGNQWTLVNIPFVMDLVDNVNPTSVINPMTTDSAIADAGHVEVGADLPGIFDDTEGYLDTDDKVSGKVVFTGVVADNKQINSLALEIKNETNTLIPTTTIATYNNGELVFDSAYTNTANDWYVEKVAETFTQATGHVVEWKLVVDTSKVKNGNTQVFAASDLVLNVIVKDTTANELEAASTKRVDIVPYITGIVRNGKTISNGELNRSKLGRYSVVEGESLKVSGYNFASTITYKVGNNAAVANVATTNNTFNVTVPALSGNVTVTVNGVESLNNMNNNSFDNNKETYYMTDIEDTSYTSSDDRYLSVWNLGNYFNKTVQADNNEYEYPVMTADKDGNLYASWGTPSNGSIKFSYGLNEVATSIYNAYDQPAGYTSVAFDTKGDSGAASVMYIGELQGNGGSYSVTGLSAALTVGGADVTQITKADIDAKTVYSKKTDVVTGNPSMKLDGDNTSGFFNLANYDQIRKLGVFINPKAARYGNYLHNIWYDKHNQSLKYSVVDLDNADLSALSNKGAAVMGYVVIDGGYTIQDRVFACNTDVTGARTNNIVGSSGNRTDTGTQTGVGSTAWNVTYSDVVFMGSNVNKDHDKTTYIGNTTSTSLVMNNVSYASKPAVGDTIALMQNPFGGYEIVLRTITAVNGNTITWDKPIPDGFTIHSATVYQSNMNVVGGNAVRNLNEFTAAEDQSSSAGSSADIDVTKDGYPMIAYCDTTSSKLKLAYVNPNASGDAKAPKLAGQWGRVTSPYTCKGSVSIKIDGNDLIHIMYQNKNGKLCYVQVTNNKNGTFTWGSEEVIDEKGTLSNGSLSIVYDGTTYTPTVTYLNAAGTADSVKYAMRTSEGWDFMILPSLGNGHYAVENNDISLESSNNWTSTDASVLQNNLGSNSNYKATATPATVDSVVAYKTGSAFETAYLKKE